MAVTDPLDARLLAALAELGKAAVHEVAAKVGMDPRDVAYRLVNLSASGLPLLVGVESDPNGLRAALAGGWGAPPQPPQPPHPHPQQQTPHPQQQPHPQPGGPQAVHGAPSGAYPVQGAPSGAYPVHGAPSGAYPVQGPHPGHAAHAAQGTPSGRYQPPPPAQQRPPLAPQQPPPPDPVMTTWGPPQSALWARGDQPPSAPPPAPATPRTGRSGDVLQTEGLEGERLAVQLLEVQDPADYLFGAAGYRLDEGERAVVVHTEITNRGPIPFASLPDNYLELITTDGAAIAKAPVSLSSRPPHKIGVAPGETTGGHTVYVLPDATRVVSVRWSPRPEPDERSLLWSIDD
ncbi:AsnC family protein [Prauserella cavernicola]|uniref:AsnC family protein n=1 Tax=Prauserella cavernicola TaxID=2800127 RepID=A0A934QXP7_9PSEU|nr:AsnC family protein [Prauserella cavernicola]MBK1788401.1 AsnC family protein [Prauserella cavernicola]